MLRQQQAERCSESLQSSRWASMFQSSRELWSSAMDRTGQTWARASTPLGKTAAQARSAEHASWGIKMRRERGHSAAGRIPPSPQSRAATCECHDNPLICHAWACCGRCSHCHARFVAGMAEHVAACPATLQGADRVEVFDGDKELR
jgi:hypothetical protein